MKLTIKFDDGYTVECDDRDCLKISVGGKSTSMHATHFNGPVPPESRAFEYLKKSGKNPDDYLYASTGLQEVVLRAGNGVRELVAEAITRESEEKAAREKRNSEMHDAAFARAKTESGFSEPVEIRIEYYDGYPMYAHVHGETLDTTKLTWKTIGNISVAEKSSVDSAISGIVAAREKAANEKAAREKASNDELYAAVSSARETGKQVEISSWTTDRCMNRNSNECSFDHAIKYAMPDGSITTKYTCCY